MLAARKVDLEDYVDKQSTKESNDGSGTEISRRCTILAFTELLKHSALEKLKINVSKLLSIKGTFLKLHKYKSDHLKWSYEPFADFMAECKSLKYISIGQVAK